MKIKEGFVLRKVADSWMAVPVGSMAENMKGLIALNETAADIWNILQDEHSEEEVMDILQLAYDAERSVLEANVRSFLEELDEKGILEK